MIEIKNDRQYNVTKGQLGKLRGALEIAEADRERMDPRVHRAMVAGIRSHIEELQEQLRAYDKLKKGVKRLPIKSFADLPRLLIAGRIARGMTQKDLADRLGIKPQQVQKYEKTEYASASLRRILDVIEVLNLNVSTNVRLDQEDGVSARHAEGAVS
jgi:ribosome-binding protein aMBF1 (putative translation factor)